MKSNVLIIVGLLVIGLGTTACGKKNGGISGANPDTLDSKNKETLFVWVENARIRKEADLNAEVITEIKGGEKVTLTGAASANKTKVNLRGVDFEDVWVKVQTADGKEGWIFKGMLTDDETRANAMNDFLIVPGEGFGQIKLGRNQKEMEDLFGKEFITKGEIFSGDGLASPGFYIFKNSSLEVACATIEAENTIVYICTQQPGTPWVTAEGVRIGTTIDQLVKLNGKPISFSGFQWAFGGMILGYGNGKLDIYKSSLTVYLGEPDNLEGLDDFMGDQNCSTNNKVILGKGVKVAEISIFGSPAI